MARGSTEIVQGVELTNPRHKALHHLDRLLVWLVLINLVALASLAVVVAFLFT